MDITIVGVGALGSHVVLFGRNFEANFKLIDFDRIESKNTMSQFHTMMGNGKNKALALVQLMKGLFKKNVYGVSNKLTEDNVEVLLGETDLVVDCVDNLETRALIQAFCRKNNVPLLHGALAANGEFGACLWTKNFKPDAKPSDDAPTCEDGEQLPFIALVSSVIASSIQAFITDGSKKSYFIYPEGIKRV